MKKILIPTDFSAEAENAAAIAARLATAFGAQLHLLHIIEPVDTTAYGLNGGLTEDAGLMSNQYLSTLLAAGKERVGQQADTLAEGLSFGVVAECKIGSVYRTITEYATQIGAELIIMGTTGTSDPMEDIILGSNTEHIIRRASCPVLAVRHNDQTIEFKKIVLATNCEEQSGPIIKAVKMLQMVSDGHILVVNIITPGSFSATHTLLDQLEKFVALHDLQNYSLHIYNDYEHEDGIRNFAQRQQADIIALSTHGKQGFARLFGGSVAEDLANHSSVPVLTAKYDKS